MKKYTHILRPARTEPPVQRPSLLRCLQDGFKQLLIFQSAERLSSTSFAYVQEAAGGAEVVRVYLRNNEPR
jgi:hypothetical protein